MGRKPSGCQQGESRYEVMLEVAMRTLADDPDLRLCEGLRLIEATRAAVARHAPASLTLFESRALPRMRRVLMERFGMVVCPDCDLH